MIKVACYCRVSTDKEDQKNSLESQKLYFEDCVNKNLDWTLVEIYFDEGITGTSTKKRNGFNQMMEDANDKKFDLIITKEVSRFARNTVDALVYTRNLKKIGIGVIFTIDNINTIDNEGELRLSLMATLAQEESRKTSERVKWGQRRSQERGVAFGSQLFGYNFVRGKLELNEDEANVVRFIYNKYLDGYGLNKIKKELEKMSVLTKQGKKTWSIATITGMLSNEKYKGTLVGHKYTVSDFIDRNLIKVDKEQHIIHENNHQSIVSQEIWDAVQYEKNKRNDCKKHASKYSNRYVYSGKIICNHCGSAFGRRTNNNKNKLPYWQCRNYTNFGTKVCKGGVLIRETFLDKCISLVIENYLQNYKSHIDTIIEKANIYTENNSEQKQILKLNNEKEKLEKRLKNYQIMRADGEINKNEYNELVTDLKFELNQIELKLNKYNDINSKTIDKMVRLNTVKNLYENLNKDSNIHLDSHYFDLFIENILPISSAEIKIITHLNKIYTIARNEGKIKDDNFNVYIKNVETQNHPFLSETRYIMKDRGIFNSIDNMWNAYQIINNKKVN